MAKGHPRGRLRNTRLLGAPRLMHHRVPPCSGAQVRRMRRESRQHPRKQNLECQPGMWCRPASSAALKRLISGQNCAWMYLMHYSSRVLRKAHSCKTEQKCIQGAGPTWQGRTHVLVGNHGPAAKKRTCTFTHLRVINRSIKAACS
jgi:hypothetical protein